MVRVAVPAVVPVMLTGLVEPKLRVGGYWALVGLEVTAAVSATLPVKPPAGVTLTNEVLPVIAPAMTLTAVLLNVKLGAGRLAVTVRDIVAVSSIVPLTPVTVIV